MSILSLYSKAIGPRGNKTFISEVSNPKFVSPKLKQAKTPTQLVQGDISKRDSKYNLEPNYPTYLK